IRFRTHDEAISTVHGQTVEQAKVLNDVYQSGGRPALQDAIDDALAYADPQSAVALFDASGREIMGNLAAAPSDVQPQRSGYRDALIRLRGQTTPHEAAVVIQHLRTGEWLLSGRVYGPGLALNETLERSLLIALILAG